MEIFFRQIDYLQGKIRSIDFPRITVQNWQGLQPYLHRIRQIGFIERMDDYERRKLGVFNLLNFFQVIVGIFICLSGLLHEDGIPFSAWLINCLPLCTSLCVLYLNHIYRHETALLCYFILYPFLTCIVYLNGMNSGIGLHFILYGVLSVFFLKDLGYMLFTVAMSMMSYFMTAVVLKEFLYQVEYAFKALYMINQALSLAFIFYGLYLIKKEITDYQFSILAKNRALHKKNLEIKKQKELIGEKAKLLRSQKSELTELNSLKNKLFSVISHDLKSPMYALRNLFHNMHQYNLPPEEVKAMVPEVVQDLNYTISLMENLLQWSKSQMQADALQLQEVNMADLIRDVIQLLRLQAEAKQVHLESKAGEPVFVYADREMINLVLRNLLSNAIKFTPRNGKVAVGLQELSHFVEVYVQDSGLGISEEALRKINENNFYTTRGTASESGTGLGLMLCKEFLVRNGGQMHIESQPGKGSVFSFTLPTHPKG